MRMPDDRTWGGRVRSYIGNASPKCAAQCAQSNTGECERRGCGEWNAEHAHEFCIWCGNRAPNPCPSKDVPRPCERKG